LTGEEAKVRLEHCQISAFSRSLPAHAVRSLIIARKKLVGQRVTLENQMKRK
jgi:hypothetical protein